MYQLLNSSQKSLTHKAGAQTAYELLNNFIHPDITQLPPFSWQLSSFRIENENLKD